MSEVKCCSNCGSFEYDYTDQYHVDWGFCRMWGNKTRGHHTCMDYWIKKK